jgi:dTDP-4-amino-4,6-dideoxygalactose transaminase
MSAIPFFLHDLGRPELDAVAQVLAGPLLTTGETVAQFERRFADYLGCKHALGVTSCTGALHMSLLALGIGAGDEVITTPLTFIATSTAIVEAGARPVFVDVEPETGLIDPKLIEGAITERTRAIMPVHLYGQMCDMRALRAIADRHGLAIIEDCAHCIEGRRDGVQPGQLGDTACFSFYATKNMTCGEGGALVFNDDRLLEPLKLLRLHGMTRNAADRMKEGYRHWDMTMLGWKYNLDNIHAALLIPQLDRLDDNWELRRSLAERYEAALEEVSEVTLPRNYEGIRHARHLFPIFVADAMRDEVIAGLQAAGVGCVVNYRAIHLLTWFRETYGYRPGDFPIAEQLGDRVLSLPFYPRMPHAHVDVVVEQIRRSLQARSLAAAG